MRKLIQRLIFFTLIVALNLVFFPNRASAAPAFVRASTTCVATSGTSTTCSFSSNSAGDTIIFTGWVNTTGVTISITDSPGGNTYTQKVNTNCSAAGNSWFVLEADNIAAEAGTNTLTLNFSASGGGIEGNGLEYSGLATSAFDKSSCTNLTSQTTPSSGNTATTSFANELLVSQMTGVTFTITASDGSTSRKTNGNIRIDGWNDRNVTSTGAYAATGTCSSQGVIMGIATFKSATQPANAGCDMSNTCN